MENNSQRKKPDNMYEEQWKDYLFMCEHPGKMCKGMTEDFYVPSKEERAYYKKWQTEADKRRIQRNTTNYFLNGFIMLALFMLLAYIFS
jgi:hypothetical protein